jgi:hypothetical protein
MRARTTRFLIGAAALFATVSYLQAQQGRGAAGPPPTPRAAAPVDLTGYWVAVVSEDWRLRIATPRNGDYESLPTLTAEGKRIADSWDIEKDNTGGLQCKAFGVGGIMRQPGRLHITWQDDNTLKVDFDAGTQTRLLRFNPGQPTGEKTWQGYSAAVWEGPGVGRGGGGGRGGQAANNAVEVSPGGAGRGQRGGPAPALGSLNQGGSLKVVTTHFREAYLRKNGVPYSESASITEYFHRLPSEPGEDTWLLVVTTVDDPKYMTQPLFTSTHFKLEANGSKWAPTPCRTAPPPPK